MVRGRGTPGGRGGNRHREANRHRYHEGGQVSAHASPMKQGARSLRARRILAETRLFLRNPGLASAFRVAVAWSQRRGAHERDSERNPARG
ncbi:hypothetical protein HMPREF0731_1575 [Pseudoroseomonas cervicalis ATCC 49957]|uniref:Uncharacterized protein n=1 Tax=Pseudoroseomonas cervicalis ATCC 49957 TaxID=525371 RepID=D5RKG5_9PROT|nr:hypothetical protein HMPREF0731_1575 [Pseudoroseomonas cervicalis ATCC 49957]